MPTSFKEVFPVIAGILEERQPARVLDMGIGYGKYGLAAREYANPIVVNGVEAYEPYIDAWQRGIYNYLYIKDIRDLTDEELKSYDLYLMIDVIEHLTKEDGITLLNRIKGPILVSTPIEEYYGEYDNHYENHISHWTVEDFATWPHKHYPNKLATIVILSP